jgi:putative ATP-dependent endonuclease of OLD family
VVFDIGGAAKFPHVYKLLGKSGFCVPMLGLVDEAEKSIWQGQIGGKPSAVFGTSLWASNPDLEGEYCTALTGPGTAQALVQSGLCRETGILSACGAQKIEDVSVEAVAKYCRDHKVEAAVAIAEQLDADVAKRIESVYGLLSKLSAMTGSQ